MNVTMRNEIATPELTALSANVAKAIEWSENDAKMVLVINASTATSLTVKAGNSIMGTNDITITVPQGVSLVKLESMKFKNVSGANKGKIVVQSPGTPSVGVVALV